MNNKKIKIVKLSIFIALCAITAFLIYSVIGYLVVWLSQPRFINNVGIVTSSWGFLIQFMIFGFFLILSISATIVSGILFFTRRDKA